MKTFFVTAVSLLSLGAVAGNDTRTDDDKYCAEMKDNRLVVVHEGNVITRDVTMSDGTQLLIDGTIVSKDGSRVMLRTGQCMDSNGRISPENTKAAHPQK